MVSTIYDILNENEEKVLAFFERDTKVYLPLPPLRSLHTRVRIKRCDGWELRSAASFRPLQEHQ